MKDLTVTLIQTSLHWEDSTANLAMFEEKIWKIGQPTDVIVLPETFTTGFTMNVESQAEMMNQQTFKWMKQMATQTKALMIGSFIVKENGKYLNRLLWMEPDGKFKTYDKRHLFRMGREHEMYTPGDKILTGEWRGWNIRPLICYDLRFPVWSRNGNGQDYDLLIYVANWPEVRIGHWNTLLRARAIENLSYTVGVNRIGTDGTGIPSNGQSAVIGPRGEELFLAGDSDVIQSVTLNASYLLDYRSTFPAHLDADRFTIG